MRTTGMTEENAERPEPDRRGESALHLRRGRPFPSRPAPKCAVAPFVCERLTPMVRETSAGARPQR